MTSEAPACPRCHGHGDPRCQVNGGAGCPGECTGHCGDENGTETAFYTRHDDKIVELRLTVPVEIRVPSDFPITAAEMVKLAQWKVNDWCDGRYPYSTEIMHQGAVDWANSILHQSIFHHYCDRVDKHFGRGNSHMTSRNKLIARCTASLDEFHTHLVDGGHIEVSATTRGIDDERDTGELHIVLCRDDRKDDDTHGDYVLATRTVFASRQAAEIYAKTIAKSRRVEFRARDERVVVGPMRDPRQDARRRSDERGTHACSDVLHALVRVDVAVGSDHEGAGNGRIEEVVGDRYRFCHRDDRHTQARAGDGLAHERRERVDFGPRLRRAHREHDRSDEQRTAIEAHLHALQALVLTHSVALQLVLQVGPGGSKFSLTGCVSTYSGFTAPPNTNDPTRTR